ncbi:MAG: hypothetical protein KDN20_21635 [Verrucomicrobiae bacterium]|nr:hypothetical protein [Verrucomicrobiae bacterium]
MNKYLRFLANPFDDPAISINCHLAFATDHLGRLKKRNGGPSGEDWSTQIAATQTALDTFNQALTDDLSRSAGRKAAKFRKTKFRRGRLPDQIRRIAGGIVYRFGKPSDELRRCLPDGRSLFNHCADDQLASHLKALHTGVTALAADLPPEVVTFAAALREEWQTIYTASESASAAKTATEARLRAARQRLQLAHYQTLLTIAQRYPDQPKKLPLYMQFHLLESRKRRPSREKPAD